MDPSPADSFTHCSADPTLASLQTLQLHSWWILQTVPTTEMLPHSPTKIDVDLKVAPLLLWFCASLSPWKHH